jgi:protein-tyrosine phosphatase
MIDLHFHLLPGIDDGPQSTAEMLELARAAYDAGTRTIVATPHLDEHWDVTLEDIAEGVERARSVLESAQIDLEVLAGAEASLPRFVGLSPAQRADVRLGDGHYVLLESPHALAAGNFDGAVERLLSDGQPLLLAHPERCPLFQRRVELLERVVEAGALCSITAASLRGRFGRTVYDFTITLLERGLVHDVASDAHSVERRGPDLLGAFEHADQELPGLLEHAAYFTEHAPRAILDGAIPDDPPTLARRQRGLFGRRR